MANEDRITVGLTDPNKDYIKLIKEHHKFNEEKDIARLAFAYALRMNYDSEIESFAETPGTVWNIGSLDQSHEMADIVLALKPEITNPYEYIGRAINVGLNHLRDLYPMGDLNLSSLMDN